MDRQFKYDRRDLESGHVHLWPITWSLHFGILLKRNVKDKLVPIICIASPVICFFLDRFQKQIFGSFELGLELLIINGLITFIGLWIISKPAAETVRILD
jgi:hypothetical protein